MTELIHDTSDAITMWKQVSMNDINYDYYEISDTGSLRNCTTDRVLKPSLGLDGYLSYALSKKGMKVKRFAAHRIVATAFLENPENKSQVNHLNHNKQDNRLVNLQWTTPRENTLHSLTNPNRKTTRRRSKEKPTEEELPEFVEISGLPNYMVHRNGKFYSKKTKVILTGVNNGVDDNGYVILNFEGKDYRAHRLVALQFIPNPENKPKVNHKNGNKQDNRVENLEWSSTSENNSHAYQTGLNTNVCPVDQYSLDGKFIASHNSIADALRSIDVDANNTTHVVDCCKGVRKYAYNHIWRFVGDDTPVVPITTIINRRRKPVVQYKLDGTFVHQYKSTAEVCRMLDLEQKCFKHITACCRRELESCLDSIWRYVDDNEFNQFQTTS